MSLSSSVNWLKTWAALKLLKQSLHTRLEHDEWLQKIPGQPKIFNRVDWILEQCVNKKVLHIGFTDHPFTNERVTNGELLHLHLKKLAADLIGIDNSIDALNNYRTATKDEQVYVTDILQSYPAEVKAFQPSLILISEVLEHLTDPYKAVQLITENFAEGTEVLVTVPNYTSLDSVGSSLHQTESIHPHHHWYFSPYTLLQLMNEKQFHLQQLHFGMYYAPHTRINAVMKNFPFNGDCIMALFTIKKQAHG